MKGILDTAITYLKGVGPNRAELLAEQASIYTYKDLLHYFPFRYVDRSVYHKISEITSDQIQIQLVGEIVSVETVGKGRGSRLVARFTDGTGTAELVWFQGARWIKSSLKTGVKFVVFGKPNFYRGKVNIPHPEMNLFSEHQTVSAGLQPVYSTTEKLTSKGLNSRGFEKLIRTLLQEVQGKIEEHLPLTILAKYKLPKLNEALEQIHFPQHPNKLKAATFRLKFDEFFFPQLQVVVLKKKNHTQYKSFVFDTVGESFNTFYETYLPFELTDAQKRVLKEIRKDLGTGRHMNRLLQGDVGSGKTVVALLSMLLAKDNGYQAALMAPTEILAIQHHTGLVELLEPMGIRVALLTGSTKQAMRREIHAGLEDGSIDFIVGTHALIEPKVKFKNLGLAIVDEQHRFGVAQRAKLWKKNSLPPHILVMTATPIPRTLAMTVYGDLEVSIIDELPPGRKPIKTLHYFDSNRLKLFGFIKQEVAKGRQVYVVYPLIQESEALDYKDLMDGYESIVRDFPPPHYQVSIVHGQMKPDAKDFEMQRFVKGETQIMVATTVIEVGVNVPNASVMIIESAERFGLSQLHQLRGRVGRGAEQSYCILMTGNKVSNEGMKRMKTMTSTNDGFKIAEVDLEMRGPGDLMGTKQSGMLDFKLANLSKDQNILQAARDEAVSILDADPSLAAPQHYPLKLAFAAYLKNKPNWSKIS